MQNESATENTPNIPQFIQSICSNSQNIWDMLEKSVRISRSSRGRSKAFLLSFFLLIVNKDLLRVLP
jgi:hypothetical protein